MLKLSDNPPIVPIGHSPFDMAGRWWIAHTRSRCEKALAWNLIDQQVSYFMPMVQRISISGGKKRRAMIPLFNSFVFLKGGPEVRSIALQTTRVCRVIEVLDQAAIHEELHAVQTALNSGIRMDPWTEPAIGDVCRVSTGSLSGVRCTAVQWGRLASVVLPLTLLRRGVLMQIESSLLERQSLPAAKISAAASGLPMRPAFRILREGAAAIAGDVSRLDMDRMRIGKNYLNGL